MRIHTTSLDTAQLAQQALQAAIAAGQVARSVYFDKNTPGRSRTHQSAADVHLVSWSGGKGTTHPRRPNSGTYGANGDQDVYAATYDEWGFFLSHLFALDPGAKAAPYYPTADAFHATTKDKYRLPVPATV